MIFLFYFLVNKRKKEEKEEEERKKKKRKKFFLFNPTKGGRKKQKNKNKKQKNKKELKKKKKKRITCSSLTKFPESPSIVPPGKVKVQEEEEEETRTGIISTNKTNKIIFTKPTFLFLFLSLFLFSFFFFPLSRNENRKNRKRKVSLLLKTVSLLVFLFDVRFFFDRALFFSFSFASFPIRNSFEIMVPKHPLLTSSKKEMDLKDLLKRNNGVPTKKIKNAP